MSLTIRKRLLSSGFIELLDIKPQREHGGSRKMRNCSVQLKDEVFRKWGRNILMNDVFNLD